MDQQTAVVFVAIAIALLAGISLWLYLRHRRSRSLRERFGPEYDRVVRQEGNVRRGEGVLEFREKKREKLHIRPLTASAQNDYANHWTAPETRTMSLRTMLKLVEPNLYVPNGPISSRASREAPLPQPITHLCSPTIN